MKMRIKDNNNYIINQKNSHDRNQNWKFEQLFFTESRNNVIKQQDNVLVSLTRLVWTMYSTCTVQSSNPDHHKKNKITVQILSSNFRFKTI